MKAIINNLLFDTDKSELIFSIKRKPVYGGGSGPAGSGYVGDKQQDFYITKNNRFFVVETNWEGSYMFWKKTSKTPEYNFYMSNLQDMYWRMKDEPEKNQLTFFKRFPPVEA